MPLSSCSSGLAATALLALLLLPSHYYVPESAAPLPPPPPPAPATALAWPGWPAAAARLASFPALDVAITGTLVALVLLIYVCEWVQRRLLWRRAARLQRALAASAARLLALDAQQERLEGTLRLVQNATAEYNLLLYLLLRRRRCLNAAAPPHAGCFFGTGKEPAEEFNFLRTPTLDA